MYMYTYTYIHIHAYAANTHGNYCKDLTSVPGVFCRPMKAGSPSMLSVLEAGCLTSLARID